MFPNHKFQNGARVVYQTKSVLVVGYGINHLGLRCGESTPDEVVIVEFESSVDSKPRREVCENELELVTDSHQ